MILNLKNSRNIILTVLFLGFNLFSAAQELSRVNFRISPQTAAINSIVFTIGELSLQLDPKGNTLSLVNRGLRGFRNGVIIWMKNIMMGLLMGRKKVSSNHSVRLELITMIISALLPNPAKSNQLKEIPLICMSLLTEETGCIQIPMIN
jgi:hypothetical protein